MLCPHVKQLKFGIGVGYSTQTDVNKESFVFLRKRICVIYPYTKLVILLFEKDKFRESDIVAWTLITIIFTQFVYIIKQWAESGLCDGTVQKCTHLVFAIIGRTGGWCPVHNLHHPLKFNRKKSFHLKRKRCAYR